MSSSTSLLGRQPPQAPRGTKPTPVPHASVEEQRQRRLAARAIKVARMWNDESISTSLLTVIACYFVVGIVGLLAILLALVLGFPSSPLNGEWPTHGWYFQIADCIMMVVMLVLVGLQSSFFLKTAFGLVIAATGLEIYSFAANIYWVWCFFVNTLSPAARAHQSLLHTGALLIILLALLAFHILALMALWHVIQLLPDLKIFYNLGAINSYGNYEDHEDEEEEGK